MNKLTVIFFLLLSLPFFSSAENLRDALVTAYEKSRNASYIAEISKPRFQECQNIEKVIYYRKFEEDGAVLLRADFHDEKGLCFSFLANRDGEFAIDAASGIAFAGGDFIRLYRSEGMLNRPCRDEFASAEFSSANVNWHGRACHRVTMQLPDDVLNNGDLPISAVSGCSLESDEEQKAHHPFRREFIIDDETGAILCLKKFNAQGKLLSSVHLGKVNMSPDWETMPEIFNTPKKIVGYVANAMEFRQKINRLHVKNKKWFDGPGGTLDIIRILLAGIGVSCLIAVAILRKK